MKQLMAIAVAGLALAAWGTPMTAQDKKDDDKGWVQLFNGKDLTGWKTHPDDKAKWEVKDGLIHGTGGVGHLYSERGDYENFIYRVAVQIPGLEHPGATQIGPEHAGLVVGEALNRRSRAGQDHVAGFQADAVPSQHVGDPHQRVDRRAEDRPAGAGTGQLAVAVDDASGQPQVDVGQPDRPAAEAPEMPRSSSITVTAVRGHPSLRARETRSYWRAVDSRLRSTCTRVDWRT